MATTHREGSVFHHDGEKVTHVESGTGPTAPSAVEASPIADTTLAPAAETVAPVVPTAKKTRRAPKASTAAKKATASKRTRAGKRK